MREGALAVCLSSRLMSVDRLPGLPSGGGWCRASVTAALRTAIRCPWAWEPANRGQRIIVGA